MNRPGAIVIGPYRVTIVSDRRTDKVLDDLEPSEEQTVALMSPWLRMVGFLDGMLHAGCRY
jgi:hypothetical protein